MPSLWSTSMTKAVSVDRRHGVAWREHDCLVVAIRRSQKYRSALPLVQYAVHACWEVIRPTVVDFPHTWAAWF